MKGIKTLEVNFNNLMIEVPLIYTKFYLVSLYSDITEQLCVYFSQKEPEINETLRYITFGDRYNDHKLPLVEFKGVEYKYCKNIIKRYVVVKLSDTEWGYECITD